MLDLMLFRRKLVAMGAALSWISFLGSSDSRFLMSLYLRRVLEYSPSEMGLIMIPPALATVVVVTMGSRGVAPRLDAVTPQVAEAFVVGLHRAFFLMACLLATAAVHSLIRASVNSSRPGPTQPARVGEAAPEAPDS